jgi:tRNA U34 5-methylaminomethyl-2-thiouridine-forming methyltransferase MnmC
MTTEPIRACLVCGDEEDLIPLYAERTPLAQPVAYIHQDCLDASNDPEMMEASKDLAEAIEDELKSGGKT